MSLTWINREDLPTGGSFTSGAGYIICAECHEDLHYTDDNRCPHLLVGEFRIYGDLAQFTEPELHQMYAQSAYRGSEQIVLSEVPDIEGCCEQCYVLVGNGVLLPVESRSDRHVTRHLCRRCVRGAYLECADCGIRVHTYDTITITTSESTFDICYSCNTGRRGENTYVDCLSCGDRTVDGSECCAQRDDDDCTCSDCYSSSDRRLIRDYSYKPSPVFHAAPNEQIVTRQNRFGEDYDASLYFGMELEVEAPKHDAAQRVSDALGDVVYLKSDSSINNGFEIVTHPMTFDYAMNEFNWAGIRQLRKDEMIGTSTSCGLHIHVSKNGFRSPTHEYTWIMFWHRNQEVLKVLAGRDSRYGSYDNEQRQTLVDVVKKGRHSYRRSAINTQNEFTHEVRVFASTVYVNRIKAAIQLVESTIQYTRNLAASKVMKDGGFSWIEYIVWLRSHGTRYAQLIKRIVDLKIDGAPRQQRMGGREVWDEAMGRYKEQPGKIIQEGTRV